jgi:hypothetical protein
MRLSLLLLELFLYTEGERLWMKGDYNEDSIVAEYGSYTGKS